MQFGTFFRTVCNEFSVYFLKNIIQVHSWNTVTPFAPVRVSLFFFFFKWGVVKTRLSLTHHVDVQRRIAWTGARMICTNREKSPVFESSQWSRQVLSGPLAHPPVWGARRPELVQPAGADWRSLRVHAASNGQFIFSVLSLLYHDLWPPWDSISMSISIGNFKSKHRSRARSRSSFCQDVCGIRSESFSINSLCRFFLLFVCFGHDSHQHNARHSRFCDDPSVAENVLGSCSGPHRVSVIKFWISARICNVANPWKFFPLERLSPSVRSRDFHWFFRCTILSRRIHKLSQLTTELLYQSRLSFAKFVARRSGIFLEFLSVRWPTSWLHRTIVSLLLVTDSWLNVNLSSSILSSGLRSSCCLKFE